jgi:hypothetical protein
VSVGGVTVRLLGIVLAVAGFVLFANGLADAIAHAACSDRLTRVGTLKIGDCTGVTSFVLRIVAGAFLASMAMVLDPVVRTGPNRVGFVGALPLVGLPAVAAGVLWHGGTGGDSSGGEHALAVLLGVLAIGLAIVLFRAARQRSRDAGLAVTS